MKISAKIAQLEQELAGLQSKYVAATTQRDQLSYKINALKEKIDLPKLQAKYNNTYWRYQNSYSKDAKWFEYIRVDKVVSTRHFKGACFAIDSDKKLSFETDNLNLFMLESSITKVHFNTFFKKFKSLIK